MQSPPFPSQLVWDDDFVMVELVSIFSEEICVGLAAGAWCDESEIIFAGKEELGGLLSHQVFFESGFLSVRGDC